MAKRQRRRREERRREHAKRDGWTTRHSLITGVGVTAGAVIGMSSTALADDFVVNSTADNGNGTCEDVSAGDCTLRDAVYDANADSGNSYISFASTVTGTVTLTDGELDIAYPAYIYGPGPNVLTVSGNHDSRIFDINMVNPGDPVGIYSLHLTDGYAGQGGAILNENATLRIAGSALTGNTATARGGALYDHGQSPYAGQENEILNTTISGNTSGDDGGGAYAYNSLGTIGTSTIQGNQADDIGGGFTSYSPSFVYSSSISGNSATYAGGLVVLSGTSSGFLYNSIVANNTAAMQDTDVGGSFYAGFDLIRSPDTADLLAPTIPEHAGPNITGQDPLLGPLQNNGGSMNTLKPALNSPVIDKGLSYDIDDQRAVGRPIDIPTIANAPGGDGGDMGSVELTLAEATPPASPPVTPKKKKKCKKKKKKHHRSADSAKKKKCKKKKKKKRSVAVASPWRQAAHQWAKSAHSPAAGHHAFRVYRP